jgi:hypothetical protein
MLRGQFVLNASELAMRTAAVATHLIPDGGFDDWVVRDDGGREIGHHPTCEAAELAARELVHGRGGAVVIHLPDGRYEYKSLEVGQLVREMN